MSKVIREIRDSRVPLHQLPFRLQATYPQGRRSPFLLPSQSREEYEPPVVEGVPPVVTRPKGKTT